MSLSRNCVVVCFSFLLALLQRPLSDVVSQRVPRCCCPAAALGGSSATRTAHLQLWPWPLLPHPSPRSSRENRRHQEIRVTHKSAPTRKAPPPPRGEAVVTPCPHVGPHKEHLAVPVRVRHHGYVAPCMCDHSVLPVMRSLCFGEGVGDDGCVKANVRTSAYGRTRQSAHFATNDGTDITLLTSLSKLKLFQQRTEQRLIT